MKRIFLKIALLFCFFAAANAASAAPSLSLSTSGGGDAVTVSVSGNPNQSVILSYNKTGGGLTVTPIGMTDGSGYLSTTVSSGANGITTGTIVTALIGRVSGTPSNTAAWPAVTASNSLLLSQSAAVTSVGGTVQITASNTGTGALYVSNNSNPSIANVSISGTSATITGNTTGTTNVSICQVGNASNCPTVYVIVSQSGSGQLSFSQNNPTVVNGQNLPITITGGSGNYLISSNTKPDIIQASISGTILTLSTGTDSGSSSVVVCSTDMAKCGVVNAAAANASSVPVSFSTASPTLAANQSATINIYGPAGVTFYVSSNSNPSAVQANLSGSTLTLTGIAAGSSAISVCSSAGNCGSITATIQYSTAGGSKAIALSQNTATISAGQSLAITITGGTQPYAVYGGTSAVSRQTLSTNILTVYGVSGGTSSLDICSSGGACVALTVTVIGAVSATAQNDTAFSMSKDSVSIDIGQNTLVSLSGNGNYSITNNTYPNVASVTVNGGLVYISGLATGVTNATVCQSSGSCGMLAVTVGAEKVPKVAPATVPTPAPQVSATVLYTFTQYLEQGMKGEEVLALQKRLAEDGYLKAAPNGYFGTQTLMAVKQFQKAHGLSQAGYVGPGTRSALNKAAGSSSSSNLAAASASVPDIATMTMEQLKSRLTALQAELAQILSRMAQLKN